MSEGLLQRGKKDKRLTWEETYRETAREKEGWSDLEATVADGIRARERVVRLQRQTGAAGGVSARPGRR